MLWTFLHPCLCPDQLPGNLVQFLDTDFLAKLFEINYEMTTIQAKDIYVTWDGDQTTWTDYTRKVRLQYEKTEAHKCKHLAPELASRLTGRAWTVTAELDYNKLSSKSGVKYLLEYLRSRLCQTAVPDAGARLEELLIKLRRPPGMGFAQWSATLLESYRKLQRSLVRARARTKPAKEETKEIKVERKTASEPQSEPASPSSSHGRRSHRSPTTRSPTHGRAQGSEERGQADQTAQADEPHYDVVPQEDPDEQGEQQGWTSWYDRWTPDQWREWLKDTKDDDDESDDELRWDELEMEEIEVLPDELLGWLLLRRANLPAAARLSVQASVQNSLKYRDIETALRDQEEELLHGDHQRQQAHRHRRTFWVEEQGAWGLLALPDDQQEEAVQDVHWVGDTLPPEVYHPNDKTLIEEDDESIYWTWEMDGYHGYVQDSYGQWMETDGYDNYWASETDDFEGLTTDQMKELEEAYSAYETKARTFQQSRQLQRAKGQSRGFYPLSKGKKGKGKSKGFYRPQGRGGFSTSSTTSSSPPKASVMKSEEVMAATSGHTGCFICGEKTHMFRDCPRRSGQA